MVDVQLNVSRDDLYACPDGYIFIPNGEVWSAQFVDKRLGKISGQKASEWFAQHRAVEGMTWAPGEPQLIVNKLIIKGGWIDHAGARLFNQYTPPNLDGGDPAKAQRWVDLVSFVYPDTCGHIISAFAFRTQHPGVKINHALVLGGSTRIGKDTIIEPLRHAVGYPNSSAIAPTVLLGRFNGFFESVVLIVSEARDLGDVNRYQLYEHLKQFIAAPPMTIQIDKKNVSEYAVPNLVFIIFTTNHKDGLYLPADDARHHCSWSPRDKGDFQEGFWRDFHGWYADGGIAHVAAYLREYDVSLFNPKAPPPHTEAFQAMVDAGRAPEAGEMANLLEQLSWPPAVCFTTLLARADDDMRPWLMDRRNRKNIGRRLEDCDYTIIRNPDDRRDGQWRLFGKRQVVYARKDVPERERLAAARELGGGHVGNVVDFPSY